VTCDLGRVHQLKPAQAGEPAETIEAGPAKAPEDGVVARVHVAALVHAHARVVLVAVHAIGLEDDPPGGRKALAQHAQQRERRLDAVQDAEAEDDIKRLPQALDIERVQPTMTTSRSVG
jgi:hypothetical protein